MTGLEVVRMLAPLAALQLVLLAQAPPPPPEAAAPGEAPTQEASPRPAGAEPRPSAPAPARAVAAVPARPRQLSLLSGESLGGGTAALAWAGWSSLGIMYGQGVTARDDLAALADYDWAKSELRVGGLYRRSLWPAGGWDLAGRLGLSWYENFGADWIREKNHSERGLEVVPGLSLSTAGSGGVFSALVEAPLAVTFKHDAGMLFSPRLSLAYEGLLYPELTFGARLGVGYRAGSGDAPLREGRAELLFLVVAGYQLL
jgi:hypothetical protein